MLREAGFIGDEHADLADNLVMFSAEASAPFLAELCGTKGLTKVSAYINAPRVQAQLLFRAGFLRPVYPNGGSTKRLLAFNMKEVDALMLSLLDGAEVLDREVEGHSPFHARRRGCHAVRWTSSASSRTIDFRGSVVARTNSVTCRYGSGQSKCGPPCFQASGSAWIKQPES
ncbi:hypothetical protein [Methylobacterium sp. WL6]|uniref:hypothetical protein n=1 Tax=Methylobacterium sp. WL6 TaxID=2603901 RepID=UPI0011C9D631|nr:hypothetical protein [Methylobacterium sp. WL6]TXN60062.1 hypothetical protein FV230_26855 [Methylobacterium sp. WL6]